MTGAQACGPGGWPTLMCQVLTTRAQDQGSRPPPSLLAQTLDKDRQAPEPTWPPTPGSLPSHAAPAHRSAARCVSHRGNKRLKRATFLSAFASLRSDPASRAYYQPKHNQDKTPWARPSSPRPTAAS